MKATGRGIIMLQIKLPSAISRLKKLTGQLFVKLCVGFV